LSVGSNTSALVEDNTRVIALIYKKLILNIAKF